MSRRRALGADAAMTPDEFTRLCISIYGPQWKKPAARLAGRDPKMIRRYQIGECRVPDDFARRLRDLGEIGPIASIVRANVLRLLTEPSKLPFHADRLGAHEKAHRIAALITTELKQAGLI